MCACSKVCGVQLVWCRWQVTECNPILQTGASFNPASGCYEVVTGVPCARHSQVFIHYGPHDNLSLLVEYGFTLPHNLHSVVSFSLGEALFILRHT